MLTPLNNVTDREEYEEHENISSGHNGNMENSLVTAHAPITVKGQMGHYALFSVVYNVLQNVSNKGFAI